MAIGKELGDKNEILRTRWKVWPLWHAAQGNYTWSVQLWAVAARWREEIQVPMMPGQRIIHERSLQQVRALLGAQTFTSLWEKGSTLSPDEVWLVHQTPLPSLPNP